MERHGLLDLLGDSERRAVAATMVRRRHRKGDTLFHEGDPGDSLYVLDRGRVAIRVTTKLGDVATLTVLGPGATFGEQALLDDSATRTASAVALEPVEVRMLHRHQFAELRRRHPAVDGMLVEVLSAQVRRLSAHLLDALYLPVEQRVMKRLAELAEVYATDGYPVDIPVRQDDVATMAGTTRPTVNRVLRQLEADDVLALGRGHLTILDVAALEARGR